MICIKNNEKNEIKQISNNNSTVQYEVTHNNKSKRNIPEIMEISKTNLWFSKQQHLNAHKSNKTIEERKYLDRVSPEESHAKALYQRNQINKGGKRRTIRKRRY